MPLSKANIKIHDDVDGFFARLDESNSKTIYGLESPKYYGDTKPNEYFPAGIEKMFKNSISKHKYSPIDTHTNPTNTVEFPPIKRRRESMESVFIELNSIDFKLRTE